MEYFKRCIEYMICESLCIRNFFRIKDIILEKKILKFNETVLLLYIKTVFFIKESQILHLALNFFYSINLPLLPNAFSLVFAIVYSHFLSLILFASFTLSHHSHYISIAFRNVLLNLKNRP